MASLAEKVLGNLHFSLEQVQDLTPTPMTLSSTMFYMGENPYTGEKIYVARSQDDKRRQKSYFFGGQLPEAKPRGEGRTEGRGKGRPVGRTEGRSMSHSVGSKGGRPQHTTSSRPVPKRRR